MNKADRRWIVVAFLCVVTLALGLVYGHDLSITLDESTTLYWSYQNFHYDLSNLLKEIHTPSYDVLLGVWLSLSKFSLFYTRLFSTLMACVAVGATYAFARRYFDGTTAVISALLLAASPLHVYYSHYARAYAFFIALSVLSSFYYLAYGREPTRRNAVLYLVSTYLLICSHIVGFTLLALQTAHYLIPKIRGRDFARVRRWLGLQAILGILYLPILVVILSRYNWVKDIPRIYYWVPKPGPGDLLDSIFFLSGASRVIEGAVGLLALAGVVLTFGSIFSHRESRVSRSEPAVVTYLLLWLFGPMLILFTYSYVHAPIFLKRGFAPSVVPWVMLGALGLSRLVRYRPVQWAAVCGLLAASHFVLARDEFGEREGWLEAAQSIRGSEHERGVFLVRPKYAVLPFAYYSDPDCFFSPHQRGQALWDDDCLKRSGTFAVNTPEEIDAALKGPTGKIWFLGYTVEMDANASMVRRLKKNPELHFIGESTQFRSIALSSFEPATGKL